MLAKVSSKFCLSAVVDARLVDSIERGTMFSSFITPTREHAHKTHLNTNNKDKDILDKI